MKILVVGAHGFIAQNLISTLENIIYGYDKYYTFKEKLEIYKYSRNMGQEKLFDFCKDCDFVFYLAGVNRPQRLEEYMEGNVDFLKYILELLEKQKNKSPVMYASSIQACLDNGYGRSKKKAEKLLQRYGEKNGIPVYIYRLSNVFGKWCKPNYNSVIATFCYNIVRELPIKVDEEEKKIKLIYIDDVVDECIQLLKRNGNEYIKNPIFIDNVYEVTLKEIADLLYEFRKTRIDKRISNMNENSFAKKLYSTYLTYLPKEKLKYSVDMNKDIRGSFTELFKTDDRGQFSVNIIKPGIIKGEHWHHTKTEKFVVVSGKGVVRIREINSKDIIDYHVSGEKIEIIDIPPGCTHNIINEGTDDLVVVMCQLYRIAVTDYEPFEEHYCHAGRTGKASRGE